MGSDIKGYYAALGVSPSASSSEIKTAYRRLAKLHHPDSNAAGDDAEIKRINEAYAILGDPARRAGYDSESISSENVETNQKRHIDPLRCSRCHKITAQPRYLIFWRVYSLILATVRTPVQGLFCASCAKAEALRSTTMTAFLGWWGIPWGPIWTIVHGIQNAVGGEQERRRNEALAWYNVVAFIQARQIPIAYGLAEKLLRAEDKEIQTAASDFTALCRSHGFKPQGELKDSWSGTRAQAPIRFAILLVIPIALTGWIYLETNSSKSSTYSYPSNAAESYPVAEAANETVSGVAATPTAEPVVVCSNVPANGEILAGRENLSAEGHRLEIDNGSTGDAIVKVRNAPSGELYVSFFAKRGETAQVDGIKDGSYTFQYAIGETLAEGCTSFTGDFSVSEFPGTESFFAKYVNDYRGEGYVYQSLSYTLYSVPGGNVRPTTISPAEFEAN